MTYRSYLLPNLQDHPSQQGMAEILSGLYIGNFRDSKDLKQLDIHKITHILSIHDDARKLFKDKKYLIINAADSPKQDLMQYVSQSNDFIHAARLRGGHVLVHCLAGISRSVTMSAVYIISVTGLSVAEALQAIRSSRTIANPNFGFQKQLHDFEVNGGAQKERERLSNHFNKCITSSPVAIPGRLIQATQKQSWGGDFQSLAQQDTLRVYQLLQKYRQLVDTGELCAGDCPNDGVSCSSGVCRAHLRSSNNSFLRRGATSNSSLRKHSSQINLWCPSLQQKLPLIQSPPVPHALSNPGTPIMKSPNYSMPRCRSENLMDQSTKQKLSPSSKPILMTSSAERLSATEANTADLHRKPSNNTRHVSWGAAASTIRATYRFSHGRPRTSPALSPSSPVLHRQQSRTVMP